MKILIYGAGVIGCTYGWQLTKAGYDITVLVRKDKKEIIKKDGINIHCTDYRGGRKRIDEIVFHPKVIDNLSPDNDYEYILVTVNYIHLKEVLPILSKAAGKAHVLFFQNIWNDFEEIAKYLRPEQYFFGFPFMAGGGKGSKGINSIIVSTKYSKTMLGEINGETTPRIQKIASAMETAEMRPFISDQIVTWLIPHSVFIAGISAGIIKAGGTMNAFISNRKIINEAIMAIREGFRVCSGRGIDPKKEKVNRLYYLPLFLSAPIVKKVFNDEAMGLMFDGYLENSADEVLQMLDSIIEYGKKNHMEMPFLKSLQECII